MRTIRLAAAAMIGNALFWAWTPGFAGEEHLTQTSTLEERLREVEKKVSGLESKERLDEAEGTPTLGAGRDGFYLKSASGDFNLKLRGYIQADGRFFLEDHKKPATDQFLLRRVRPIFEGNIYKYFDFRIMPDFGNGKMELQDAYLEIRYWPAVRLRAGKFKGQLGLERLQSGADLKFVERALPTNLVPNRDVGFQLNGELFNGALSYAAGAFNGVPDGASGDGDSGDDKEFEGRLFAHPFKGSGIAPLEGVGIGAAGSFGKADGTLPSFKSPGQNTFFNFRSTSSAAGDHYRIAPQGYYYWGPVGVMGEYVVSALDAKNGSSRKTLENDAWQVAASYLLTGEKASYKSVDPKRPFDPRNGSWGAFEVAARYSGLSVDKDAFPVFADPATAARKARAWGVGANWYLNRSVKIVLDYEQTAFDGGNADGSDREDEKVVLTRFQLAY